MTDSPKNGNVWDTVIKIFAGAVLVGGLTWVTYLQGKVDAVAQAAQIGDKELLTRSYGNAERIAVLEANYATIKETLTRIETKLDTEKEVRRGNKP